MRLSLDSNAAGNGIRAYAAGSITVNDQAIRQSVIVTPEQVITDHLPESFTELTEAHFDRLHGLAPEIVLVGTGARQRFPHPRLLRGLLGQGIGVEIMDTAAACRTYNVVMAEGRRVAALLLMIED